MVLMELIYTMSPIMLSGVLHMLIVRAGLFQRLEKPLDAGVSFRGQRVFGDHKTWRGLLIILATTLLGAWLLLLFERMNPSCTSLNLVPFSRFPWWQVGLGWGLGYALAELPNSFLKRQFGLAPGKGTTGQLGIVLIFFDQADSAIGCGLVAYFFFSFTFSSALGFAALGTVIHLILNALLGGIGVRRRCV
jgi:hypothetical protein